MNKLTKQEMFDLIRRASDGDVEAQEELRKVVEIMPGDGKPSDKKDNAAREREENARKVIKDLRNQAGKNAVARGKGK